MAVTGVPSLAILSVKDFEFLVSKGVQDMFDRGNKALNYWSNSYRKRHLAEKYKAEKRVA